MLLDYYDRVVPRWSAEERVLHTSDDEWLARLVNLYASAGRARDAAEFLRAAADAHLQAGTWTSPQGGGMGGDTSPPASLTPTVNIANRLRQMGRWADALRVRVLSYLRVGPDSAYGQTIRPRLVADLRAAPPKAAEEGYRLLLVGQPEPKRLTPPALGVYADGDPVGLTRLRSRLADQLAEVRRPGPLRAALDKLATAQPDELKFALLAALLAEDAGRKVAATRLAAWGEQNLPKPTGSAHAEAGGLWLAARACLAREGPRDVGEALAKQAVNAARRGSQLDQARTILLDWGELELRRGNRQAAADHWLEAASLVAPSREEGELWPVSYEQAHACLGIAGRAAEAGLTELSLACVGQALKGGPPPRPNTQRNRPQGVLWETPLTPQVFAMERHWPTDAKSSTAVYDVLVECVLPSALPGEVRWYLGEFMGETGPAQGVASLGTLLVRWAVPAGKAKELGARLAGPPASPRAEAAARLLRVQLAREVRDERVAAEELNWFRERPGPGADPARGPFGLPCGAGLVRPRRPLGDGSRHSGALGAAAGDGARVDGRGPPAAPAAGTRPGRTQEPVGRPPASGRGHAPGPVANSPGTAGAGNARRRSARIRSGAGGVRRGVGQRRPGSFHDGLKYNVLLLGSKRAGSPVPSTDPCAR
jgi:hypothetical protein